MSEENREQNLEQVMGNWYKKQTTYEYEHSITNDSGKKFELKLKIKECEDEIKRIKEKIEQESSEIHGQVKITYIKKLKNHINRYFKNFAIALTDSKEPFSLEAYVCEGYDEIERIHQQADINYLKELYEEAFTSKTLIESEDANFIYFHAPGGFGKTSFLMQMMKEAIDNKIVPFYLDLKKIRENEKEHFNNPKDKESVNQLFKKCSIAEGSYEKFESFSNSNLSLIIIFDGINECIIDSQNIIDMADYIADNHPSSRLFIADRMRKKIYPQNRSLKLATILPLKNLENYIDKSIVSNKELLKILCVPFFLDLYIKLIKNATNRPSIRAKFESRVEIFKKYFMQSLKSQITSLELEMVLDILSKMIFRHYEKEKSLIIKIDWWNDELKAKKMTKIGQELIDSGIIVRVTETTFVFRHQLLQDFLAGYYLTKLSQEEWKNVFDQITFYAKSFEALEFASELLGEKVDDFITELYDWNYLASVDCILNLESSYSGQVSQITPELKDAIFSLIAAKKFDLFVSTRDKISPYLSRFSSCCSIEYHNINSREHLISEIQNKYQSSKEVYNNWKELFTKSRSQNILVTDMVFLFSSPVIAWTAANIFRHTSISEDLFNYLIDLYSTLRKYHQHDKKLTAIRRRIVHILGNDDKLLSKDLLLNILADEYENYWVRHDAIRSLIELTSRQTQEQAKEILKNISRNILQSDDPQRHLFFTQLKNLAILDEKRPHWWDVEYNNSFDLS